MLLTLLERLPAMRHAHALRAGFTLLELLVVIAIIGILVATFASSTASAHETARITKATAESRELGNAIRLYLMTELDTSSSDDIEGDDPMGDLGLTEGVNDISSALSRRLATTNNDAGHAYFAASQSSMPNNQILDPWGNPYKIRMRRFNPQTQQDEDYVIILPVLGRHRTLDPLTGGSGN